VAGRGDIFATPRWKLPGTFVLKVLKIDMFKLPHREREPKVFQGERSSRRQYTLQNVIKVDFVAMDGNHCFFGSWYIGR
jgi:hypothetical protein